MLMLPVCVVGIMVDDDSMQGSCLTKCVLLCCREWCSLLILLSGVLFSFGVLLTISERFFCPALELISDYLKLPPVVAGATLLSFGNGAPDIFTQVAAVGQVSLLWHQIDL